MTDHANHDAAERVRAERFAVITKELRHRLRPVCATMPDDLFHEMIDEMAELQLKYELIRDGPH